MKSSECVIIDLCDVVPNKASRKMKNKEKEK